MVSNKATQQHEKENEKSQSMLSKIKKPFHTEQRVKLDERGHNKRARLIVRNISYKASEESLREHFQKFGEVEEINLLKRPENGKLVGCAFVQFATVNQATKAIVKGNGQQYLGRPVFIDWALGKDVYLAKRREAEVNKSPQIEIKNEENDKSEVKAEESEGNSEDDETDSRPIYEESRNSDEESMDTDTESEDNKDDIKEDKKDTKILTDVKLQQEKRISNDVQEGCTVFLKNVPFDASDDDLRKVCRKFGPVCYAIINREKISGHSKGTAFVKFKSKDSADLCLQSGEQFILMEQVMDPYPALSREEIKKQALENSGKGIKKDARNLYLAREGLIMTGSKSAQGVSASDMTKRHELERIKAQVLKNLNRFVSRNRLSIHNLPLSYDNEKLKQMVISYTGYRPHECRVMRENKITPEHPKGKSKGFGFMSFNTHQEALTALRKLNNNPKIFSDAHRPIVAFSIEDRDVHRIKKKREEKSKINNPTFQQKLQKRRERQMQRKGKGVRLTKMKTGSQKDDKKEVNNRIKEIERRRLITKTNPEVNKSDNFETFVGTTSKPGTGVRLRSNKKIKEQSEEHMKRVKAEKRKSKQHKIRQIHKIERKAIVRPKQGRKIERDDLLKLVNKYKRIIDGSTVKSLDKTERMKLKTPKRTKWYKE